MSLKKKKNVLIITCCMVSCYFLYQLYFFLTITSEGNKSILRPVLDQNVINGMQQLRSEFDKYINEYGKMRGVYFADVARYRPDSDNEFKCKTSSQRIAFEQVNDDYCDCSDNSDEPSTAACPNGIFYCDTQPPKRKTFTVPSGKVNDGICDCCDGSDEWLHENNNLLSQTIINNYRFYVTKCPNTCNK